MVDAAANVAVAIGAAEVEVADGTVAVGAVDKAVEIWAAEGTVTGNGCPVLGELLKAMRADCFSIAKHLRRPYHKFDVLIVPSPFQLK